MNVLLHSTVSLQYAEFIFPLIQAYKLYLWDDLSTDKGEKNLIQTGRHLALMIQAKN